MIIIFGAIGVAIFIVGTDGSVYALSFLLLSIFLIIRAITRSKRKREEAEAAAAAAKPAEPAPKPEDVALLEEIRDLLKDKK